MKKILLVLFLFSACTLSARTTCEDRVDAHQRASTVQRVDYCLNEPEEEAPVSAEVIYYGVVTPDSENAQEEKATAKDGYYKDSKMKVSRGYLGTRQFPAFTNNRLSESERERQRKQLQQAQEELAKQQAAELAAANAAQAAKQTAPSAVQDQPKETTAVTATTETKAGLARRQKKPARFDHIVTIPEAEPVETVASAEPYQPADGIAQQPQEGEQAAVQGIASQEEVQAVGAENAEDEVLIEKEAVAPSSEYNPYYESGVAVNAPVTYDQISK